jgi:RHS repeat-associated protein
MNPEGPYNEQHLRSHVEARLMSVSGAASATFYDGDGNRVKATLGGATTVYVGNYFEWTGSTSTMVKYYYAGGQRVAMRKGSSTLYFLLGDHLGSTSITANSSGGKAAELRYHPYSGTRYTSGTTPTSFRFTGQREDATIGLYFYNARYYDPALGRFISADTIVPSPSDPQALNRYSYCLGRPLVAVDPSGHFLNFVVGAAIGAVVGGAFTGAIYYATTDNFDKREFWCQFSPGTGPRASRSC